MKIRVCTCVDTQYAKCCTGKKFQVFILRRTFFLSLFPSSISDDLSMPRLVLRFASSARTLVTGKNFYDYIRYIYDITNQRNVVWKLWAIRCRNTARREKCIRLGRFSNLWHEKLPRFTIDANHLYLYLYTYSQYSCVNTSNWKVNAWKSIFRIFFCYRLLDWMIRREAPYYISCIVSLRLC